MGRDSAGEGAEEVIVFTDFGEECTGGLSLRTLWTTGAFHLRVRMARSCALRAGETRVCTIPHLPSHNPSCSPEFEWVWEPSMTRLSDRPRPIHQDAQQDPSIPEQPFACSDASSTHSRNWHAHHHLTSTSRSRHQKAVWGQLLCSKLDRALRRLFPLCNDASPSPHLFRQVCRSSSPLQKKGL